MIERVLPLCLLLASNVFMTFAWYGHLKYKSTPLPTVILASWGIAFFEYTLQVPANRLGSAVYSGFRPDRGSGMADLPGVNRALPARASPRKRPGPAPSLARLCKRRRWAEPAWRRVRRVREPACLVCSHAFAAT
jgi:hypothetical protein